MALAIICAGAVIAILLYYYLTANFDYWKSQGVKGPKPIPGFGTIASHLLGKSSLGSYLRKVYEDYPNESMVGIFLRGKPALVIRDPDLMKTVLIKEFSVFPERNIAVHEKVWLDSHAINTIHNYQIDFFSTYDLLKHIHALTAFGRGALLLK